MDHDAQSKLFIGSEGDAWFRRNSGRDVFQAEHVQCLIGERAVRPKAILEIGCSDGRRLEGLMRAFQCAGHGLDPSREAIQAGMARNSRLNLAQGTADTLPYADSFFDVIIYGFCLYLCDRSSLFRIAAEGDRCLKDGGAVVVIDFLPHSHYSNEYVHKAGVRSYKMDHSILFSWNPQYYVASRKIFPHDPQRGVENPDERVGITLVEKDSRHAYPKGPHSY